ncbi:MAG: hypothetical protein M1834_005108 [Cirrosporium novae-zelandiae]|nr:MAG: hypothetical protein M1834_005108 [Cirrosporium novae-zelandiae]
MAVHYGGSRDPSATLYSLSFSEAFDTQTTNMTALFTEMGKAGGAANNIAPNTIDGTMLTNDDAFYLYGGLVPLTNSSSAPGADDYLGYERFQWGPYRASWTPGFIEQHLNSGVTRYTTNGAGVSVPSENLGFYFSGMRGTNWDAIEATDASANILAKTLIIANISIMRDEILHNNTLPSNVPGRANAELLWMPVSTSGLLVAIGGVIYPEVIWPGGLSVDQQAESRKVGPAFMQTVPVYDIANERWYMQNTSGDIPTQLTAFCSVLATAPDNSSFNIYIYGGYDGLNADDEPFDDVYILSLPSFIWIRAYSGDVKHGRSGHKCVKVYPDQIFVLGGQYLNTTNCVEGGIIQVFNLNTLAFQNKYDPKAWSEYRVPDVVTAKIGGDSNGGATVVAPSSWANDSLSSLFKSKYTKTITTWYPYNSSTSSPTPTLSILRTSSTLPEWVPPVLGVVVGLVIISIILLCSFYYRRRLCLRRQSTATDSTTLIGGTNKWILYWMHGTPHWSRKTSLTNTLTTFRDSETVMIPQRESPNPLACEAAGEMLHEMQAGPIPIELPTSYNMNSSSHSSPTTPSSFSNFVSPLMTPSPFSTTLSSLNSITKSSRPSHLRNRSSTDHSSMISPLDSPDDIGRRQSGGVGGLGRIASEDATNDLGNETYMYDEKKRMELE